MNTVRLHIDALCCTGPIGPYSPLINHDDLEQIVVEMEEALKPCDQPLAASETKRLASCYPTFKPSADWTDQIVEALGAAPCDLIVRTVAQLSETETFPPNKATVKGKVSELVALRRTILARAKTMLAEHARRECQLAEEAERAKKHAAFRENLKGRSPVEYFRREDE